MEELEATWQVLERANRLEEMTEVMKIIVAEKKNFAALRDMFFVTFKRSISESRKKWTLALSAERKAESIGNERTCGLVGELRLKQETLAANKCWETIGLITVLESFMEDEIFLKKLKADCFRYLSELHDESSFSAVSESAANLYMEALALAEEGLLVRDPLRLGIALNWSVFLHDVLHKPKEACVVARNAFDAATRGDNTVVDSNVTERIQMLRDNLVRWTSTGEI